MLDEPSTWLSQETPQDNLSSVHPAPEGTPPLADVDAVIAAVLDVKEMDHHATPPALARYVGTLRITSAEAYARVDAVCAPLGFRPVLTVNEAGQHVFLVFLRRAHRRARSPWLHVVLLVLTVLSLLSVGAAHEAGSVETLNLLQGWPFALSLLAILGAHEMGHYLAAKAHGVRTSWPYFIPFPFNVFGTLGAFIMFREPVPNRRVLFDISAAGPLAGFVVAVPVLLLGLATSNVQPLPQNEAYMLEGNSILYASAKYALFGQWLPDAEKDVFVNQVAWAGWSGLLLTALNLIPAGQLDGGHIAYALLGERVRKLYWPLVSVMVALAFLNSVWWLLAALVVLMGKLYAPPLDGVTPLDARRRRWAYVVLVVLVLTFVPLPLRVITP